MSASVLLQTALRLPAPDLEALIEGRMIAAMPRIFLNPGRLFALYPADASINLLPIEQHYRSNFLSIAQNAIAQLNSETVTIKAWAKCELCQMLNDLESLESLSRLTIWTTEALQQILSQRPYIFLAHLRVYLLPQPLEMPVNAQGQFVPLPHSLTVSETSAVLSDRIFSQRRHQLENRLPPLHPELEELQSASAQLAITNPKAEQFNHQIKTFLGWTSNPSVEPIDTDLSWINTINSLGTATSGGKFEKGDAFEKIVRKSLAFLGFELDANAKGGAGGMDLYCTKPYPLVGECKAGQSIPSSAVEEIIRLGGTHLGLERLANAAKLIIGPSKLAPKAQKSAEVFSVSVINPMTLQKLVELQAKYPGSVNLMELKSYLEAGHIDSRIDDYINKVNREIELRSQIVQAVKQLAERNRERVTATEVCIQYTGSPLTDEQVHDLLIELSSPLTGYLGREYREKGSDWRSDRFYFLRNLE